MTNMYPWYLINLYQYVTLYYLVNITIPFNIEVILIYMKGMCMNNLDSKFNQNKITN